MPASSPFPDLLHQLQGAGLETRADQVSRVLYSTDASIYQIEPLAIVLPRHRDEVAAALTLAGQYQVPVTVRGAGSSLAGQAIGAGLIIDCSRYLNRIDAIQLAEPGLPAWAEVEPGVVLERLNRQAGRHLLQFGPDPASAERATIGGSLANNATGAHSIQYGMFADHVLQVEVVLADGSLSNFAELPVSELPPVGMTGRAAALYQSALELRANHAERIRASWPRLWRRASGYNLNYLLPWSADIPPRWDSGTAYPPVQPGHINLAALFAGSEGTLGIVTRARLRLVPKAPHTVLAVLAYDSVANACDDTPRLLELAPSAVELLPRQLIELARAVPAYARLIDFLPPGRNEIPPALLVVEFSGQDPDHLLAQLRRLGPGAYQAVTAAAQARIWAVRKVGLGLLMSAPGDAKPLGFMEDIAVPVGRLGDFVRQIDALTSEFGVTAAYYAHASAGCLHIRPVLDLKTGTGVATLRKLAAAAMQAGLRLGGVPSGEHGDGLARSEWLPQAFGEELMGFHYQIKQAADPDNLLNPGKIVDPVPMDQNLRYGPHYHAQGWQPVFSFHNQISLLGAIEMCNGAGVCRKDGGLMCPSFQATREEMHATRGRANLLRAFLSNQLPPERTLQASQHSGTLSLEAVYQALDLCLACKGCKAECPSNVDVARLKYEFLHYYYQQAGQHRRWRDYLFGYIDRLARLGQPFGRLANWSLRQERLRRLFNRVLGLAPERQLPAFAERSFKAPAVQPALPGSVIEKRLVLLLLDAFSEHFYPAAAWHSLYALQQAGFQVAVLPQRGAGRTLISKGLLPAARTHALRLVDAIKAVDPDGRLPVIGIEPSEIFTLSDEYLDFFPEDSYVLALAQRAWMIDEFLVRHGQITVQPDRPPVLLHGHCYQKARPPAADGLPVGVAATVAMLTQAGYPVEVVDAGCCGMAGAFGYEAEHYQLSLQIGEQSLFPAVRAASPQVIVAAAGVSCQAQIEDGTRRQVAHPVTLI